MYVLVLAVAGWVNPTSATISAPRPSQAIHRPRARVVLLGLRCEIREQPDARVMQLGFLHDVVAVEDRPGLVSRQLHRDGHCQVESASGTVDG